MWERWLSLSKNGLAKTNKNGIKITDKGQELLKSKNKEYFIYKNTIETRLKSIKHPKIFKKCLHNFIKLPIKRRKNIILSVKAGYDIDYEDIPDNAYNDFIKFGNKINNGINNKDIVFRTISNGMYETNYGAIKIINIPVNIIKKILREIEK